MDLRLLSLIADMTDEEKSRMESQILMAQSDPLCLDPESDGVWEQFLVGDSRYGVAGRRLRDKVKNMSTPAATNRRRKFLEHEDVYPHRPVGKRILELAAKRSARKRRKVESLDDLTRLHRNNWTPVPDLTMVSIFRTFLFQLCFIWPNYCFLDEKSCSINFDHNKLSQLGRLVVFGCLKSTVIFIPTNIL
jgi:hypothetical protein